MKNQNWTEDDVADFEARKTARRAMRKQKTTTDIQTLKQPETCPKNFDLYYPYRNRLEHDYAVYLELQKRAGEIEAWGYEKLKFRLADGKWWKPDFLVIKRYILYDGHIEIHETKGYDREAAALRRAVAAELFPWFDFYLVRREKGAWNINLVRKEKV